MGSGRIKNVILALNFSGYDFHMSIVQSKMNLLGGGLRR